MDGCDASGQAEPAGLRQFAGGGGRESSHTTSYGTAVPNATAAKALSPIRPPANRSPGRAHPVRCNSTRVVVFQIQRCRPQVDFDSDPMRPGLRRFKFSVMVALPREPAAVAASTLRLAGFENRSGPHRRGPAFQLQRSRPESMGPQSKAGCFNFSVPKSSRMSRSPARCDFSDGAGLDRRRTAGPARGSPRPSYPEILNRDSYRTWFQHQRG